MHMCVWLDLSSENFKKSSTVVKASAWAPVQLYWVVVSNCGDRKHQGTITFI